MTEVGTGLTAVGLAGGEIDRSAPNPPRAAVAEARNKDEE